MKHLLYSLYLTLLLGACRQSDTSVSPADVLYQRWQLVGSTSSYITFLASGVILYGKDGTDGVCCGPRVFVRQDSLLNFTNVPPRIIPAFVQKADCSAIRCAPTGDSWRIITLTKEQLVLQTRYGRETYRAE